MPVFRPTRGANATPRIVVVCTGNYCRSPLAEALLRRELPPGIDVASAGTNAVSERLPHPFAQRILTDLDFTESEIASLRPSKLVERTLQGATLVLTAEVEHRRQAVALLPQMADCTFTLKEFARLVADAELPTGTPTERLLSLREEAASRLPQDQEAEQSPGSDDIRDPMGQSQAAFDACFVEIVESLAWSALLRGPETR